MKHTLLAAALLVAANAAIAVDAADTPPAGGYTITTRHLIIDPAGTPGHPGAAGELHMFSAGGQVANAPFSAEIVTEKTQMLQDGNQIVHKSLRRTYRDSLGRMRNEVLDDKGQSSYVHIIDPTDKMQYTLLPRQKTATRVNMTDLTGKPGEDLRAAVLERGKTAMPGERFEIVGNVRVATAGKPLPATIERVAQLAGMELADRKWAAQATTTPLGNREIEGVRAEGSATSYTIPAGEIGNQKPITVTTEKWFSPELQIILSMKRSDPRSGETGYRVTNLKRGEQSRALFSVPEDYKVSDLGKGFRIAFPNKQ